MPHPLEFADPATLTRPQRALQLAGRGDWQGAHDLIQAGDDRQSAWIHAYLHRQEGDQSNAQYWYRSAGQPLFRGSLEEEWRQIADALYRPE